MEISVDFPAGESNSTFATQIFNNLCGVNRCYSIVVRNARKLVFLMGKQASIGHAMHVELWSQ